MLYFKECQQKKSKRTSKTDIKTEQNYKNISPKLKLKDEQWNGPKRATLTFTLTWDALTPVDSVIYSGWHSGILYPDLPKTDRMYLISLAMQPYIVSITDHKTVKCPLILTYLCQNVNPSGNAKGDGVPPWIGYSYHMMHLCYIL